MTERIIAQTKFPQKAYHIALTTNDEGVITRVGLYLDGKTVGEYVVHFRRRKPAILYLLRKCYTKMEADYIARERRVNYALGEEKTVGVIRTQFTWTEEAKAIREAIAEVERAG